MASISARAWAYVRSAGAYYWRCIALAWHGAWAVAGAASAVLGLLVPPYLKTHPALATTVNDLVWQIPLGVLGSLSALRLILAPYWIYREQEAKLQAPKYPDPAVQMREFSKRALERRWQEQQQERLVDAIKSVARAPTSKGGKKDD